MISRSKTSVSLSLQIYFRIMQILPKKELTPFIRHYLFLDSRDAGIAKCRLFTDGNPAMVLSLKHTLLAANREGREDYPLPDFFIYGQIDDFKDIYSLDLSLVLVVFQPNGLHRLLDISATEIRNQIIPAVDFFGCNGIELREKLIEAKATGQRVQLLNDFFSGIVCSKSPVEDMIVSASLDLIFKQRGIVSMSNLTRYTGYTERHIERKFLEAIGMTPKKFSNIVRLHGFLRQLTTDATRESLTMMSYEYGYSDQAHLINQFKKTTGITPREYKKLPGKFASNFIQLSSPA